jgi:hypothetical protein
VSCAALAWTAVVDRQRRLDAKRQEQAVIDGAIARVVAHWGVTRLRTVTVPGDPILDELKQSAKSWRDSCLEPLAVLPQDSRAHELIEKTVEAASAFERIIDPMRAGHEPVDANALQNGLTELQATISDAINKLTALSRTRARP